MHRSNQKYITVTFQDFITIYQMIYKELFYPKQTANEDIGVTCEPIIDDYQYYLDTEIGNLIEKKIISLKDNGYHYIPNSGFNVKVNVYPCEGKKDLNNFVYILNPGIFRERGGKDYIFIDIILPSIFENTEMGKEDKEDILLFGKIIYEVFCNLLDEANAFYMMILIARIAFPNGLEKMFDSKRYRWLEQHAPYPYSVYDTMGSYHNEDFQDSKNVFLQEMIHYTNPFINDQRLKDIFCAKEEFVTIEDRNTVLRYLHQIGIAN